MTIQAKDNSTSDWILFHLNIQCLSNKINFIDVLNEEIKPNFLCLTEHWYTADVGLDNAYIQGYKCISYFCRKSAIHGGSVIYVRADNLEYCKEVKFITNASKEQCIECSAVSFKNKVCIISIYRPPIVSNFDEFLFNLEKILNFATNRFPYIILWRSKC